VATKPRKPMIAAPLRPRLTCPHCWTAFPPGDIMWVAEHPSLNKDNLLGENEGQRFLPSRFDPDGNAIDTQGVTCHDLACPHCHLLIPRAMVELESVFISTLGAPSSGKSYFLASMVHQTQDAMLRHFQSNLADVDPVGNEIVNDYLNKLFRNSQPQDLVAIEKTQQTGRQYTSVSMDQRDVYLPKPFVYSVQPLKLQDDRLRRQLCRAICLYDNAGEHFMPGKNASQLATQHLAHSRVLLYLFDPLQHSRFRQACMGRTNDPQLGKLGKNNPQDQVILEAARRVRNLTGLPQHAQYSRPLVVVVTKYDVWHSLLAEETVSMTSLLGRVPDRGTVLDLKRIKRLSDVLRKLLYDLAPDIVAAAEGFSNEVIYLPNSAFGCSPEVVRLRDGNEALGIRPANLKPMLAELPLLYALHRAVPTLVPGLDRTGSRDGVTMAPVSKPLPHHALPPAVALHSDDGPATHHAAEPRGPVREIALTDTPAAARPKVNNYLKEAGP